MHSTFAGIEPTHSLKNHPDHRDPVGKAEKMLFWLIPVIPEIP